MAATAINPNTVLRAYRDFEQAGLVELRRGLGTFVTRSLVRPGTRSDSPLRREVTDWVARAGPEAWNGPMYSPWSQQFWTPTATNTTATPGRPGREEGSA